MKKVYLDNNIIVYLEKNILELSDIYELIGEESCEFYYAHLQEVEETTGSTELERNNWIQKRLDTIDKTINGNYLAINKEDNTVYLQKEKSKIFLDILREVSANSIMKSMLNITLEEQKETLREHISIDIGEFNEYRPFEAVEHIDTKLRSVDELTFFEMIDKAFEIHPQGKSFGFHHRVVAIFEYLDMLGYWRDTPTNKSNYARLWDSFHAFFASFCDYFISNDENTREKAKFVYNIFEKETRVLKPRMN